MTPTQYQDIVKRLHQEADESYRLFHSRLLPPDAGVIGVRMPKLHALAKEIAQGDPIGFLAIAKDRFYEETMLQGLVIGKLKAQLSVIQNALRDYISKITNWALCDNTCAGLKITKRYPQEMWIFLQPYLRSQEVYDVRFGVVMLLDYFLQPDYLSESLDWFAHVWQDDYYVQMAVGWAVSVAYVRFREETESFLLSRRLSPACEKRALQKILESNRVSPEDKACMKQRKKEWER